MRTNFIKNVIAATLGLCISFNALSSGNLSELDDLVNELFPRSPERLQEEKNEESDASLFCDEDQSSEDSEWSDKQENKRQKKHRFQNAKPISDQGFDSHAAAIRDCDEIERIIENQELGYIRVDVQIGRKVNFILNPGRIVQFSFGDIEKNESLTSSYKTDTTEYRKLLFKIKKLPVIIPEGYMVAFYTASSWWWGKTHFDRNGRLFYTVGRLTSDYTELGPRLLFSGALGSGDNPSAAFTQALTKKTGSKPDIRHNGRMYFGLGYIAGQKALRDHFYSEYEKSGLLPEFSCITSESSCIQNQEEANEELLKWFKGYDYNPDKFCK